MATTYRPNHGPNQGANARAINWNDRDEAPPPKRGNWLPLDDLDDEDMYVGTPQLHAVPAPMRQPTTARPRPEWAQQTAAYPGRATLQQQAQGKAVTRNADPQGVQAKALAIAAGAMIALLGLYVAATAAVEWVQVKANDMQYGRPRTMQMDAYVGHSETEGVPSHFIAMNLNRRVTILEIPGGDSARANTLVGPYLFGQGEDLTPVQLSALDVNSDGQADLLVSIKEEQLIYLNDGAGFKLMTPEEQASLQRSLSAQEVPGQPAVQGQADGVTVEEAGK
ncbi:MAG: hypothetical protein ABIO92_08380 [Chloroflexia bacterium]